MTQPAPVRLFDTARHAVAPLATVEPGVVRLYVCGLSTSGPPHVGHGRSYVVFDTLRRVLEHAGYEVRHVQNFTDIEQAIVTRAKAAGETPQAYAERMIQAYFGPMDRLAVQRAHHYPRVTEYMDRIIAVTQELLNTDCAYPILDGVAFRTEDIAEFGELLGRDPRDAVVHEVDSVECCGRRSPFDFILWRNTDDVGVTWKAPWGEGRPGWHTECSVMATHLLGPTVDIHGGGADLVFPHHASERAIAECVTGKDFVGSWFHNGLVTMERSKMSKSLGNVVHLEQALDEHGAAVVRLAFLSAPPRETLEWNAKLLEEARALATVLRDARARSPRGQQPASSEVAALRDRVVAALRSDLDLPRALEGVRALAREQAGQPGAREALDEVLGLLGVADLLDAPATA